MKLRKKLIEVVLPLDAINKASAREKSLRHGHPSTLHLWWARRPLAAARAVIFAQMVDDPGSHPELFPTEETQQQERERLFDIIRDLVLWENTTNERVLNQAREEIWKSWRRTCAENQNHPRVRELFNREKLPAFYDPFAGGGSLPLEAQRLGLEAYASDLNPVAVLINKLMIEIPPRFADRPPVNPESLRQSRQMGNVWRGAQGLAEDVRYYGKWMRDEAEKRIGHFYPKVEITAEMARERPDLKALVGRKLTVIAWIWARTVKSPNPAFASIDVPLASTFILSRKEGKEAWIEPVVEAAGYDFRVRAAPSPGLETAEKGTKNARGANFRCLMSGIPISAEYIRAEGTAGRMGARIMAVVAEGDRERVYLAPDPPMEVLARSASPTWMPEGSFVEDARAFTPCIFGLKEWRHLFSDRQLLALTTFSDLLENVRDRMSQDRSTDRLASDDVALAAGGLGFTAYVDAVNAILALAVDKAADYWSTLCFWHNAAAQQKIVNTFGRQAISMSWDFAEANPFSVSSGHFLRFVSLICEVLDFALPCRPFGSSEQQDAAESDFSFSRVVSTDPPYFDNVPYADLSDFFYVWLRHALKGVFPNLFATVSAPKAEELVAFAYRHVSKAAAHTFFLDGMTRAMQRLSEQTHPAFPVTIYYAFRQAETDSNEGTFSTGWETFLAAVIRSGFAITGTWPVRTEYTGNLKKKRSALASSIVLTCRRRAEDSAIATRREFVAALKAELPTALFHLQRANIAPVDLAQAAIGPGMAIYSQYSKVISADGKPMPVREALALINQTLDEALAEQEGDFDADSRWALAWFEQSGFDEGEYGVAEMLSKAKNTSVSGMVEAGILASKGGKVHLLRPDELPSDWDPETDLRLTAWESVHHLVRALEAGGENAAAELVAKIGGRSEISRELAYRLYTVCERKKRAQEALSYNGLVQSWPEITRLARDGAKSQPQVQLFDQE